MTQELVVLFFLLVLFYSLHSVLNQHKLILKVYHVINTNNIHVILRTSVVWVLSHINYL